MAGTKVPNERGAARIETGGFTSGKRAVPAHREARRGRRGARPDAPTRRETGPRTLPPPQPVAVRRSGGPEVRPPPSRLGRGLNPLARPVLAGRDDAVLLGDEQCGRDGVLVPLDLAQEHRTAALRPGVDLGRHVRAAAAVAASGASGPSADGGAGGDARVSLRHRGPRGCRAAVSSRVLPPPVLPGKAAQLNLRSRQRATEGACGEVGKVIQRLQSPSPKNGLYSWQGRGMSPKPGLQKIVILHCINFKKPLFGRHLHFRDVSVKKYIYTGHYPKFFTWIISFNTDNLKTWRDKSACILILDIRKLNHGEVK